MKNEIAAGLVVPVLVFILLSGGWKLMGDDIAANFGKVRHKRNRLKSLKKKKTDPAAAMLEKLASSALEKEISGSFMLAVMGLLFSVSFMLGIRSFRLIPALMLSLLAAAIPPFYLFVRLCGQQSKSSREGTAFVTELNRQYRMHQRNIFEALEQAAAMGGDFPICAGHCYRLLLKLRQASGSDDIKAACNDFSFALGTVWGGMLAGCIRVSAEKGRDISEALTDISNQLKTANKRAEERKRLNSEAGRMTVFLVPLMYGGTAVLSHSYLDMSYGQFFRNQFLSSEGLAFFMVIVFLFVFNLSVLKLVSSAKLDF